MFSKGGSEAIRCLPANPVAPVMRTRLLVILSGSLAPIVEQVSESLLEGKARLPPGPADELRGIGEQNGNIRRPEPFGVHLHPALGFAQREEIIQDLADGAGGAPPGVVDFPRGSFFLAPP